ncbi:MAG: HEPN domain-containing protein [Deltaproteobacteria bacterium]|nr:HEPN domain-containing protein [Deltaproteobacteria bacterium]
MNATVKEWFAKAEKDFATARRELAALEEPNYDAVCFHAQQCVEKLMKGLLISLEVTPPKTHDLAYLHQLLAPVCPEWSCALEDLRFLTRAAVAFRYPGESADLEEAQQAFRIASNLREKLFSLWQLKGNANQ